MILAPSLWFRFCVKDNLQTWRFIVDHGHTWWINIINLYIIIIRVILRSYYCSSWTTEVCNIMVIVSMNIRFKINIILNNNQSHLGKFKTIVRDRHCSAPYYVLLSLQPASEIYVLRSTTAVQQAAGAVSFSTRRSVDVQWSCFVDTTFTINTTIRTWNSIDDQNSFLSPSPARLVIRWLFDGVCLRDACLGFHSVPVWYLKVSISPVALRRK